MKWTAKNIALCAVLAALALGLSTLEGLFPISLLVPLPGVKLGLANIVTVFALYQLGAGAALAILLTRCLLGGLFAGNLSAMLFSVLGGLTAMLVMIFLRRLPKLSVAAAVSASTAYPWAARRRTTSARWLPPASRWAAPWSWAISPFCWPCPFSPVR